jgi:hypothetical protein
MYADTGVPGDRPSFVVDRDGSPCRADRVGVR